MGQVPSWYNHPSSEKWWIALAAAASLGFLFDGLRRLRDTTLTAPLLWGCAAVSTSVVAGWIGDNPFANYAVAIFCIAPTLAQLGAKRPQNGAWQFIVLTLVGVLLLPVFQGLAFGDQRPQVHALFRWLVGAHIIIGVVNYLPTRFAGPILIFGAAQLAMSLQTVFLGELVFHEENLWTWSFTHLHGSLAGSVGMAIALFWARRNALNDDGLPSGMNRLWRDFRDAYGLVWGMRVAERLNAAAGQHGWPVEFTWGGIVVRTESGELPADVQHRVERELRSMLRRFVSHDWIARRLPHEPGA